jgi:hypothetical protein
VNNDALTGETNELGGFTVSEEFYEAVKNSGPEVVREVKWPKSDCLFSDAFWKDYWEREIRKEFKPETAAMLLGDEPPTAETPAGIMGGKR